METKLGDAIFSTSNIDAPKSMKFDINSLECVIGWCMQIWNDYINQHDKYIKKQLFFLSF